MISIICNSLNRNDLFQKHTLSLSLFGFAEVEVHQLKVLTDVLFHFVFHNDAFVLSQINFQGSMKDLNYLQLNSHFRFVLQCRNLFRLTKNYRYEVNNLFYLRNLQSYLSIVAVNLITVNVTHLFNVLTMGFEMCSCYMGFHYIHPTEQFMTNTTWILLILMCCQMTL